jgi:predicted transcriptional regulator
MIHAESALHIARKARTEANKQREKAENAARAAHDAIIPAQLAFEKASNTLKEITKKHQGGRGTVFFLNADLNEQRRFLPKSQFVIAQKRAGDAIQSISSPSS